MAKYTLIPALAEAIAKNLRNGGYPNVTAEMVQKELHQEPGERTIIGMWAAGMCEDNGILPDPE